MGAFFMIRLYFVFFLFSFFFNVNAQEITLPLKPPLQLTGNFCENRRNHFHAGIDLRIAGKPDMGVFSVWNGYVSRIRYNAASYGRAVYITHPNGLTSVYGHLDSFAPNIDALVKSLQYSRKTFEIDYTLPRDSLMVIAGERIGVAGNSGYSFGAHLHFELRKTATDEPINPLFLYLDVIDASAPQFKSLVLYTPLYDDCSAWRKSNYPLKRINANNSYSISTPINVPEQFALGFELVDFQSSNWAKMQIIELNVKIDDTLRWGLRFDAFSFDETNACGSLYDPYDGIVLRKDVIRTYKETYNNLGFYQKPYSTGLFSIPKGKLSKLFVEAIDANGNRSTLSALLKRDSTFSSSPLPANQCRHHINPKQINVFETNIATIRFDTGAIFNSFCSDSAFVQQIIVNNNPALLIGESYLSVRKPYQLKFYRNCISQLVDSSKWIVVQYDSQKNISNAWLPARNKMDYVIELSRFGVFSLVPDTIAPVIKKTNIPINGVLANIKMLEFTVIDNSTAINSYKAYLNNEWILMTYDLKNDLFSIDIRDKCHRGNNLLVVMFTDLAGNETRFEKNLNKP